MHYRSPAVHRQLAPRLRIWGRGRAEGGGGETKGEGEDRGGGEEEEVVSQRGGGEWRGREGRGELGRRGDREKS